MQSSPDQRDAGLDFGNPHLLSGVGVAARADRHRKRQFTIAGVRMIPPQIAIETGGALDRPRRALVERDCRAAGCRS